MSICGIVFFSIAYIYILITKYDLTFRTKDKGDSVNVIIKATPQFLNRVKKRVQELNGEFETIPENP